MDARRSIPKDTSEYPWTALPFSRPAALGRELGANAILIHIPWLHAVYEHLLTAVRTVYPTARTARTLPGTLAVHYLSMGDTVPTHACAPLVATMLLTEHFRGGQLLVDDHKVEVPWGRVALLPPDCSSAVEKVTYGTRISVTMHYYLDEDDLDEEVFGVH